MASFTRQERIDLLKRENVRKDKKIKDLISNQKKMAKKMQELRKFIPVTKRCVDALSRL